MALEIIQMTLPQSKYNIKCPYAMPNPSRVVVHNTASDASAKSEISYMQGNGYEVSYHYAVDDVRAVQGLPLDRNGWHAGDGQGAGNRQGIGVEICYSKSGGDRFVKAEKNGALLVAMILVEKGWGLDRVTKHQDYWQGTYYKYCPHRTLDLGWQRFLNMVQAEVNNLKKQPNAPAVAVTPQAPQPTPVQVATTSTLYLPSSATSWRVYNQNGKYTAGNEVGYLNPSKFGGLTYTIHGNPVKDIYLIKTQDFGTVAIYAGAGTGAVVSLGKAPEQVATKPVATNGLLYGITSSQRENGTFYPNSTRNIRTAPNTNSEIIGTYENGQSFTYHTKHVGNGYTWLEYTSYSGNRRFVACRTNVNGVKGNLFGYIV